MTEHQPQNLWAHQTDAPEGPPGSVVYENETHFIVERTTLEYDEASKQEYVKAIAREELESPTNWLGEVEVERIPPSGAGDKDSIGRVPRSSGGGSRAAPEADGSEPAQRPGCEVCNNLYLVPGQFYSVDVAKLKRSAAKCCMTCLILDAGFRHFDTEWNSQVHPWSMILAPSETALQVSVNKPHPGIRDGDVLDFYTLEGEPVAWGAFGVCRDLSKIPGPPEQLNLAREWLEECEAKHRGCNTTGAYFLPRRILDVRATGGAENIVLLEPDQSISSSGTSPCRYACLSHCWGRSQPAKLLRSNLKSMKSGISVDSLPKTFRDAVQTARALGLDYLWVDSLCIIQDDDDDWQREAHSMAEIYGKATLTISASRAASCEAGFLHDLLRDRFFRIKLDVETIERGNNTHNIRARPSHNHDAFGFGKKAPDATAPLRARAWAFQEYLLSPRVLQFGMTEMVWECREHLKCECEAGFLAPLSYQRVPWQVKAHYQRVLAGALTDPALFQRFWEALVRDYTAKKITKDKDRLVALAGVAEQMGRVLSLEYHSGLWVPDLRLAGSAFSGSDMGDTEPWMTNFLQSLVWRTAFCTVGRRPTSSSAPTWLWASVEHDDGIVYALKVTRPMAKVLDIRSEPYGAGGAYCECLKLISSALPARLHRIGPDGPALSFLVERNGAGIPVYPDVAEEAEHGKEVLCLNLGVGADRLIMLILTAVEGSGGMIHRRLGTTGANRKAPDRMKFLAGGGDMQMRAVLII